LIHHHDNSKPKRLVGKDQAPGISVDEVAN
jgi:hypothetical protein